jgi:HAD superfamily hydrolase (TIGR01549 family)
VRYPAAPMRYDLVCLDAGFTLLMPRRTLADALGGVLEQRGHPVSRDDLHRAWEVADRWFWQEYHRPDNQTWGSDERIEQTWRDYHSVMLQELGFGDRRHELLDAILESQFAADAWELYPEVAGVLGELRSMDGIRIGVVSDWGSNLEGILAALGLDRYLDFVLASGEVGVAKPDPALYRIALERGAATADRAVMVGDSLRADVEGARAAGIDGVLLVRPEGPAQQNQPTADVPTISSLAELPALVRGP